MERERASLAAVLADNNRVSVNHGQLVHASYAQGEGQGLDEGQGLGQGLGPGQEFGPVTHSSNHISLGGDLSPDDETLLLRAENARLRLEMAEVVVASSATATATTVSAVSASSSAAASPSNSINATTSHANEKAGNDSNENTVQQQQQQQQQQQREITALWGSIHELSRLDAMKDEALRSVMDTRDSALLELDHALSERDKAVMERDNALALWRESNRLYEELHRDLSIIQALDMLNGPAVENCDDTTAPLDAVAVDKTHTRSPNDHVTVEDALSGGGPVAAISPQTQGHPPLALVPLSTLPQYMYPPSVSSSTINLYPPSSSLSPTINSSGRIKTSHISNTNQQQPHHHQQQHQQQPLHQQPYHQPQHQPQHQRQRQQLQLPYPPTTSPTHVNGRSEVVQAIVSSQHPALASVRSPPSSSKHPLLSPTLSTTPPLVATSSAVTSLKKKSSPTAQKSSPTQLQLPNRSTARGYNNGYITSTTTTNRNNNTGDNRSTSNGRGSTGNAAVASSSSTLREKKLIEQIDELSQYLGVNVHDHNRGKPLTTTISKTNGAFVR